MAGGSSRETRVKENYLKSVLQLINQKPLPYPILNAHYFTDMPIRTPIWRTEAPVRSAATVSIDSSSGEISQWLRQQMDIVRATNQRPLRRPEPFLTDADEIYLRQRGVTESTDPEAAFHEQRLRIIRMDRNLASERRHLGRLEIRMRNAQISPPVDPV